MQPICRLFMVCSLSFSCGSVLEAQTISAALQQVRKPVELYPGVHFGLAPLEQLVTTPVHRALLDHDSLGTSCLSMNSQSPVVIVLPQHEIDWLIDKYQGPLNEARYMQQDHAAAVTLQREPVHGARC